MDRLISEQNVLDVINEAIRIGRFYYGKERTIEEIKAIPSAEPKEGHWIEEDVFDGDIAYRCSECNELFWLDDGTPKDNEYNFCPKCGKRMVEPQESEKINCKSTKYENCINHNYCDYESQESEG